MKRETKELIRHEINEMEFVDETTNNIEKIVDAAMADAIYNSCTIGGVMDKMGLRIVSGDVK